MRTHTARCLVSLAAVLFAAAPGCRKGVRAPPASAAASCTAVVVIDVRWPGADPAETEQVVVGLERLVAGIEGIERVDAIAGEGGARVQVVLGGADPGPSRRAVMGAILDRHGALPEGVSLSMAAVAPSRPLWLVVLGDGGAGVRARALADELFDPEDVLAAVGLDAAQVIVELDPTRAAALGVDPAAVRGALAGLSDQPFGAVSGGGPVVRAGTADDLLPRIAALSVGDEAARPIRIADVATVRRETPPLPVVTVGGRPAAALLVAAADRPEPDDPAARVLGPIATDECGQRRIAPGVVVIAGHTPAGIDAGALRALARALENDLGAGEAAELLVFAGQAPLLGAPRWSGHFGALEIVAVVDGDAAAFAARARRVLAERPGVRGVVSAGEGGVGVRVTGENWSDVMAQAAAVEEALRAQPGVLEVLSDAPPRTVRLDLRVDRERAAALGLTTAAVAQGIRLAMSGVPVAHLRDGATEAEVLVRLGEAAGGVEELSVAVPGGGMVRLTEIATIVHEAAPAAIVRRSGQRAIALTALIEAGAASRVERAVRAEILPRFDDDRGVRVRLDGAR
jgi:multidrug efflux pump subunit AcrB